MPTRDVLLAAGSGTLAAATFIGAGVLDDAASTVPEPGSARWWTVLAILLAQATLLIGARRRPRTVLVATAVAAVAAALAGAGDATSAGFVAVVVATYVVGTTRPLRGSWPALAAAVALVAAATAIGSWASDEPPVVLVAGSVAQGVGTLGLTLLVAVVVATRQESAAARAAERASAAREQQALLQAAVARERTAMARELHDIAAHHLSGIAVMTSAIATQIDSDPAAAKAGVGQVREQSKAVLRDLRSLVGLLREGDPTETVRPENLAGIPALAADAAAGGRDVGVTVLGDRDGAGIGPLAQLAAYRVVQEALSNALQHAPGAPCEVVVDDRSADAVVVTVRNGRASGVAVAAGTGFGLVGMRERAELTGATLEVGPTDDGGWQVAMRLPRDTTQEEPT